MNNQSTDAVLAGTAKPNNPADGADFRTIDNTGAHLAEVDDFPGVMAVIRRAAKNKGVRFDEADFKNGEVVYTNQNVVRFTGKSVDLIDRIFKGRESGLT